MRFLVEWDASDGEALMCTFFFLLLAAILWIGVIGGASP